jgi:hypothetical protein
MIERTERGWAGHFACGYRCRFHRNTMLFCPATGVRIIVSTVGAMMGRDMKGEALRRNEKIAYQRYYETVAFHTIGNDTEFYDIDVGRPIYFDAPWEINQEWADNEANAMHEAAVAEIAEKMATGQIRPPEVKNDG